jgi:hypothetical protein
MDSDMRPERVDRLCGLSTHGLPWDTSEVRWFGAAVLPDRFVDWFTDGGHSAVVERRRDAYRVSPAHDIGLKRRDNGPLEAKVRIGPAVHSTLDNGFSGRLEEWRKYAVDEPRGETTWEWSEVTKVILTRTYGLDEVGAVQELTDPDLASPGCDIELASVSAEESVAWTFAVEAWGQADTRRRLLGGALVALAEQTSPIPSAFLEDLDRSMGYPEWLATVVWRDRFVSA